MTTSPVVRHDLVEGIRVLDDVRVVLSDGVAVSLKIWLPEGAEDHPVPGVLEAMPYRKDDVMLVDDAARMGYVAGHGYACVRMDLRGSGNSEGVLLGEYHPQEQVDIAEVIAWIAEQPWCDGGVGLTGMSWSGCNTLHMAARRPPALKAIISVYSTDDHYDNDIHYMGGAVLAFYLAVWGHVMLSFNTRPGDPEVMGEAWRKNWHERLEANLPFSEERLSHQRRDPYWERTAVRENPADIECPALIVGGWSDAYTDSVFRLLDGIPGVRQGIIGPWGHTWPERAVPGPSIGFLQENVRWWDRWLKGIENHVEDEPLLRYFVQDVAEPRADLDLRSGAWQGTDRLPTLDRDGEDLWLSSSGLALEPDPVATTVAHSSPLTLGATAGSWLPYGTLTDLPTDQRDDDAQSLTFDSGPLRDDLTIFGQPQVVLAVSSDQPDALVVARLCAVAPDGTSSLITRGALNLTHRDSHVVPSALEPGTSYEIAVDLKAVAERVPRGHSLRLAISTQYWPWLWPSPKQPVITVSLGEVSRLRLPTTELHASDVSFGPAEIAPVPEVEKLREHRPEMTASVDPESGLHTFVLVRDLSGASRFPSGLVHVDDERCEFSIHPDDPWSARAEMVRTIQLGRGAWQTSSQIRTVMSCTAADFQLESSVRAFEGDEQIFERSYHKTVGRDHV